VGNLILKSRHRLLCKDSTNISDVERLMNGDTAELCFTSPPYSDQREYGGGLDLSTQHLASFIPTARQHVKYFVINLGYSRKHKEVNTYWDDYINSAHECGLKFLSWNIWDRYHACSIGQQTAMFPIEHEWLFVFGPNLKDLNHTVENKWAKTSIHGSIARSVDGCLIPSKEGREIASHRALGTIVRMNASKERDLGHPAVFPVQLSVSYIEAMTDESEGVYEPFCGSGSTLIACEKMNRKCYAMEIDPHYCDITLNRYSKYCGKTIIREDGELWVA
jgi:DNA modification methylase